VFFVEEKNRLNDRKRRMNLPFTDRPCRTAVGPFMPIAKIPDGKVAAPFGVATTTALQLYLLSNPQGILCMDKCSFDGGLSSGSPSSLPVPATLILL
jgi:hypothetical protein